MNKNSILLILMVCFFAASGYLLYNNFFAKPAPYVPGRGFAGGESGITDTDVKILDGQVDIVSKSLDATGIWSTIDTNEQYQSLDGAALIEVTYEGYTTRTNPFLPLIYPDQESDE